MGANIDAIKFGGSWQVTSNLDHDGALDEIRVCATERSAAWIAFEYANGYEADNEISLGSEEVLSGETVTWTGDGADNLASTDGNWLGGSAPGIGDTVVLDGTSGGSPDKNMTWDLALNLAAWDQQAGYSGTVTPTQNVATTGDLTITGGTDAATNDVNVTVGGNVTMDNSQTNMGDGDWTITGNFDAADVTTFNADASSLILSGTTLALGSNSHPDVTTNPSNSAVATLNASSLGQLSTTSTTLDLGSSSDQIVIAGDLTLDGTLSVRAGSGFGAGTYVIDDGRRHDHRQWPGD